MMESPEYSVGQNGENKLLKMIPEFKITYLKKVTDPGITKSPSWPNSPTIVRSDTSQGLNVPAYMTLGRKGFTKKVSDEEFGFTDDLAFTKRSSDPQVEEIRSMLSSLDVSKYLRKPREQSDKTKPHELMRSISVQPQMNANYFNISKKSFLDDIPPPPRTSTILHSLPDLPSDDEQCQKTYSLELTPIKRNSRPVNAKLKELTERLRPSSAPPSPHRRQRLRTPYTAPPLTNFSFWKDPLPDSEAFDNENGKDDLENRCEAKELLKSLKAVPCKRREKLSELTKVLSLKNPGYATLPRAKQISLSKSKNLEPRTLACLDLNTSIDSYRSNECVEKQDNLKNEDDDILKKDARNSVAVDSQRSNKIVRIPRNPLLRQEECENEEQIIPTAKTNSLKSVGKKREEFDLNFCKYGSLTYPNEKKEDRRRSLPKIESQDKPKKSDDKITSTDQCGYAKDELVQDSLIREETDKHPSKKGKDSCLDLKLEKTNSVLNGECERKNDALEPQSAPVSSLEEEIRTIAKLLDGKESLFLKLIQSSKNDKKGDNSNLEPERSFSPTGTDNEMPKSISDLRTSDTTGRCSPSRLRAMTVPTTSETNKNPPLSNIVSPPQQKRYFKKRLRGPYGEMLEQEMSKSLHKSRPSYAKDLDFLKELENLDLKNKTADKGQSRPKPLLRSSSHSFDETHTITVDGTPKRKTSANLPIVSVGNGGGGLKVPTTSVSGTVSEPILHIRSHSDSVKTSSTWNVDQIISGILKQPLQQNKRKTMVKKSLSATTTRTFWSTVLWVDCSTVGYWSPGLLLGLCTLMGAGACKIRRGSKVPHVLNHTSGDANPDEDPSSEMGPKSGDLSPGRVHSRKPEKGRLPPEGDNTTQHSSAILHIIC